MLWSRTLELFDHAGYVEPFLQGRHAGAWRADLERQGRSSRAISLDRHRQPLSLRADDPPERDRARPRGAAGEPRRQGRAHRVDGELHRSRAPAVEAVLRKAERRERDGRGRLAGRLRRRPFDRAAWARLHLRRHDARTATGTWPTAISAGSSRRTACTSSGTATASWPSSRSSATLAGHRRSRPGPGRRAMSRSDAGRRSRRCIALRGTHGDRHQGPDLAGRLPHQRAQGQEIRQRPRLPGRRCRAYPQPGRRPGHEHRHAGRLQPRLEARARDQRRVQARRCSTATRPSAAPSATWCCAMPAA